MTGGAESELAIFGAAALVGLLVAWWVTRDRDDTQPGPAVRIYAALFKVAGAGVVRTSLDKREQYPRREAFLASWFLVFFSLFLIGVFIWPTASSQ
jgi:cytochrome bd-type quinol oxidase subunit 2